MNYANGKIYIIRSNSTQNVYIGSTTQKLSQRMGQHRSDFKTNRGRSSSEMIKQGDAYIELIEKFPCEDKEDLHKREGEVMRATENTVNKQLPGRTQKEYSDEHKVEIKQYYQDNKGKISIRRKRYYNDNKDKIQQHKGTKIRCQCGEITMRGNLARHEKTNLHKQEMEILELGNEI